MGLPRNPFSSLSLFLSILTILELTAPSSSATDYTTLVYKGCAKQPLQDPTGVYSQALSSIFGTLIAQSAKSKFYKTTAGSSQTTITGLFQCRGDLSNVDCYSCVSRLPTLIDKLCGKPIAARIQLFGCYMLYEVSGFSQISGMEMLYKSCGGTNVGGAAFEERRDTALNTLENGIGNGNGFYTANYESVVVLGLCEGDVGNSDCVACVKQAVQRAQVECGSSASAQVYLHKCYISYSYYPNGVPRTPSSASDDTSPSSLGVPNLHPNGSGRSCETNTQYKDATWLASAATSDTARGRPTWHEADLPITRASGVVKPNLKGCGPNTRGRLSCPERVTQ